LRCVAVLQGGYEHYMQKEIHEQPDALLQSMRGRVKSQRPTEVSFAGLGHGFWGLSACSIKLQHYCISKGELRYSDHQGRFELGSLSCMGLAAWGNGFVYGEQQCCC
jgi:hypothetical protein